MVHGLSRVSVRIRLAGRESGLNSKSDLFSHVVIDSDDAGLKSG